MDLSLPPSSPAGCQSASPAVHKHRLTRALETVFKREKHLRWICASLIWDVTTTDQQLHDCLYRWTQRDILFDFKRRRLERDSTPEGEVVADSLERLLSSGPVEPIREARPVSRSTLYKLLKSGFVESSWPMA